MLPIDIPPAPPQGQTIVIAQAPAPAAPSVIAPQFEKTFTGCQDVGNAKFYAKSAFNSMPLLPVVLEHLGYAWTGHDFNVPNEVNASIKSGVLEVPIHGRIVLRSAANHIYSYEAEPNYVGQDKVIFWVEVSGRRFKIVQNLAVVDTINERGAPLCQSMKFSQQPSDKSSAPGIL